MSKKQRRFGAVTDDPLDILSAAHEELRDRKTRYGVRQAAEKAHLALTSAIEVAARRPMKGHGDELATLKELTKRLKEPSLEGEYRDLRRELHSECFHQDRCSTPEKMFESFGKAGSVINRLLRAKKKQRR